MANDKTIPATIDEHFMQIPPTSQEVIDQALTFCASVTAIEIHDNDAYTAAAELTKKVTAFNKSLEAERKSTLKPLHDAVDYVNAKFRAPQQAIKNIDMRLRQSIASYLQDIEDKRREEQRRADEAARKERARLEAEARDREAKAVELAENGQAKRAETQVEKAEAVKQVAMTIVAPKIESTAPKVEGVHAKDKYTGTVTDKTAFLEAALHGEQAAMLLDCVDINTGKLNKIIQAAKGKITLPGVDIHCEKVTVIRQ